MSNILMGVGRAQLEVLDDRVEAKRTVLTRYEEVLGGIDSVMFIPEPEGQSLSRWLRAMTLDPEKVRITPYELMDILEAENIEARPVWKPLHLQPLFEACKFYTHVEDDVVNRTVV